MNGTVAPSAISLTTAAIPAAGSPSSATRTGRGSNAELTRREIASRPPAVHAAVLAFWTAGEAKAMTDDSTKEARGAGTPEGKRRGLVYGSSGALETAILAAISNGETPEAVVVLL